MLTIISVSYKSKNFLKTNYQLVKTLNPTSSFQWIVVQNTPESEEDLSMDDPCFTMIKGPVLTAKERECSFYRSIHHAKGLNIALAHTDADSILILDPDCFILLPNWIDLIEKQIQQESLVFLGVPYHPKYFTHYRGFPNAICMFINRRLMQEQNHFTLDFTPVFEDRILWNQAIHDALEWHSHSRDHLRQFFSSSTRKFPLQSRDFPLAIKRYLNRILDRFLSHSVLHFFREEIEQWKVHTCRDTGYRIYDRYRSLLKHQTFEIFALDPRSTPIRLFESILPDRYRTYPRNTAYIRNTPSPLFDEFGTYGEQFFWNDQLFGFHLKGVLDNLSTDDKNELTEKLLSKIKNHSDQIQTSSKT